MDPTLKSFLAAALYAFISTSITFFNKAVLASYAFQWPNIMTLVQMLFSLVFLVALRQSGAISFPRPNWAMSRRVLPLSMAFCAMVLTGLGALKYLNIPMFNSLRRATTLITMVGESYLLGSRNTRMVQLTVWLMIVGAMLAGAFDLDFSVAGYVLVGLNCVFTAAYLLYIAQLGKSSGLNSFGLMFYNNAQALPVVLLICVLNGDFDEVASYEFLWDPSFVLCFLFQSALAFLLNYSIFLCTQINSALATSVTGQMKNIVTTAVGYVAFGDVTFAFWNVVGVVLGVVASSWYSLLKFRESEAGKKQPVLPTASPVALPMAGAGGPGWAGAHAHAVRESPDPAEEGEGAMLLSPQQQYQHQQYQHQQPQFQFQYPSGGLLQPTPEGTPVVRIGTAAPRALGPAALFGASTTVGAGAGTAPIEELDARTR